VVGIHAAVQDGDNDGGAAVGGVPGLRRLDAREGPL
jgi:hypothetical protein